MQALITEVFDLVLRWRDGDGSESTVQFSLANNSEFITRVHVLWNRELNYQGALTVSFETMCYGQDLLRFQDELLRMVNGTSTSARFANTGEDFEIRIAQHGGKGQRTTMLTELRYRHHRTVGDLLSPGELVLPIGVAQELAETAKAIKETLRILKVDCRGLFDLPQ